MAGHVEREFKLGLPGEDELQALARALGGGGGVPVLQRNHFFDTSARALRRGRIALRLREEADTFALALKGPRSDGGGALAARPEEELALDHPTARAILAGARSPLEVLGTSALASAPLVARARELALGEPLVRLGGFENERLRIGPLRFPPDGAGPPLVFELDRTRFPGGRVDREVELELPAGADAALVEEALRALLARLGIAPEPVDSKAARLFRLLDGPDTNL